MSKISFTAIGTYWEIDLYSSVNIADIEKIVRDRVEDFEQTYSRFRSSSFLNKISSMPGTYTLPDDARELFDIYFKLNKSTNGKFTPVVGGALEDAGYDKKYSFISKPLRNVPDLNTVIEYNFPNITIKEVIQLDLGAAGKGYIIWLIGNLLKQHGVEEFTIDAGGDILHKSAHRTLKIGLENPLDTKQVIGYANIKNTSICGSAGNRRKWADFHHIIDPVTLKSPKNILATWVIYHNTAVADALATCIFFVNPKDLIKDYYFEYLILYEDLSVNISSKFPGELFDH